jgi:glycosyltransferase involved in cell wall biosynthesis
MAAIPEIHIFSEFSDAMRGSENRALSLYEGLSRRCRVTLWTETEPDSRLSAYPIRRIAPFRREFPFGGTLVFVGAFFEVGAWFRFARPDRTIVIYNTFAVDGLRRFVEDLRRAGAAPVEIVYAANWVKEAVGLDGVVQASLIDIERFSPAKEVLAAGPFCVGRLSRDDLTKHHLPDLALYRNLVEAGCKVRIMGGTVLREQFAAAQGIELLPVNAQSVEHFLRGIDCFYYRTADDWLETFGRVVVEAMACGLPVVAHWRGGYSEWIDDGETGFLIETPEEALATILRLKQDTELRARVGHAARAAMEALYSAEAWERTLDFYCPREP